VGVTKTVIAHFDPRICFVQMEIFLQSLTVLRIQAHHKNIDFCLLAAHSFVHVFTTFQRTIIEGKIYRPCRWTWFLGFFLRRKWFLEDTDEQADYEAGYGTS
jgi:hypothetical protein